MNLPFLPRIFAAWPAVLALAASHASDEAPPAASLPVPPAQHEAFTAPASGLPPDVVEAADRLFTLGLADPRGCEYREIEVTTGDCWGEVERTKTHGWVLPGEGAPRYAVAWNGLVYPVLSVGPPANLRADAEAGLAADKARLDEEVARFESAMKRAREEHARLGRPSPEMEMLPTRWPRVEPEASQVSLRQIQPIRAALLLRVGEGRLAGAVWKQWFDAMNPHLRSEPFKRLAGAWLWSRYDRGICAHMRGDDHLALADAAGLAGLRDTVLREADERAEKNTRMSSTDKTATQTEKGWLGEAASLETDTRRRLAEPPRVPVLDQPNPPAGAERIAGLIRDLELVAARQQGQPGGVRFTDDPIVQALVKERETAVPALLDCLENDTRLTRSVEFHRDFIPNRHILGVHEAAFAALSSIFDAGFSAFRSTLGSLSFRDTAGRKLLASNIRDYWQRYKNMSVEERWYATLADEKSSPSLISETAELIVRDSDRPINGPGATGAVTRMQGESLRSKAGPGVAELLLKHLRDFSQKGGEKYNPDRAMRMAYALAKWDGPAHIEGLRQAWRALSRANDLPRSLDDLVILAGQRHRIGDPEALSDYAAWLLAFSPEDLLADNFDNPFDIMWEHPDDPAIQEAAKVLFLGDGARLAPAMDEGHGAMTRLITTPLIGLREFREAVLRRLHDKTALGIALLQASGAVEIRLDGGSGEVGGFVHADPLAPPPGESQPLRVCDLYAWKISRLEGAPKFPPIWPVEKRDAVIAEAARFLQRYGGHFQFQPGDSTSRFLFLDETALIHFPRLDRPATPGDVERGRAIFSLDGERRVWPMPSFPMAANWITLRDNPSAPENSDPGAGESQQKIFYQTSGRVFQAEEVLENGEWKLYFGFAGPFHLAKVPGEEIRFPPANSSLSDAARFSLAITRIENLSPFGEVRPGVSGKLPDLKVSISLRNCVGKYQPVPPSLLSSAGGSPASGVILQLDHSPRIATAIAEYYSLDWKTLPLKPAAVLPSSPRPLAPATPMPIASADLRGLYDLQPGSYRLQVLPADRSPEIQASGEYFFKVLPGKE